MSLSLQARCLLLLALGFAGLSSLPAQDRRLETPADLAARVRVVVEPTFHWRYSQDGAYENPTQSLLTGRRAFFPSEKLRISFALPDDAKAAGSLQARVELGLTDLDGVEVQNVGAVDIRTAADRVEGALDWVVPEMKEGSYLLAARFADGDGRPLLTRSEIVFAAPEYPRLLADAQAALTQAGRSRDSLAPLLRDVSLPSVEMLLEDAQIRFSDFGRATRDWDYVKDRLETARRFADEIAAGRDPYRDRSGTMVKAYRSELDDTLQPYGLHLPRGYDPSRRYPLVVSLHGAGSNHLLNLRRVFGLGNRPGEGDYEAIRNEVALPDVDFIVATPYGRGEFAGYTGIGENDVLRVMESVQKAYNVDPDRVHLTGLSMGGGGTWHLGLRYPDRFASLTPVCAVAHAGRYTRDPTAEDTALFDLTSAYAIAENAASLRVFMFHGDEDKAVPVEQSRTMAKAFEGFGWLGGSARYFELPGVHHFAWDLAYRDASLFERVRDLRRTPVPARVVYTTHSPRYRQAYWLRIDRIDKGLELARIEGERAEGRISVKTRNLAAFSILLSPELAPSNRPVDVVVDGKSVFRGAPAGAALSFARRGRGTFARVPRASAPSDLPDHGEAGLGSRSIVEAAAHLYVYGTGGGAETTDLLKRRAETLADWRPRAKARWNVMPDTVVTPELMRSRNLVLVGNARTNAVVAKLAAKLPLRDEATGVLAGTRRVAGADAAYRLICPNPEAPGRYVLVYGAASAAALDQLLPTRRDVRRPSTSADYLVIDADGSVKLAGLFRNAWRVGE
jgi:pimeloyl-ACP methyl ester carboxylesterase